MTLLARLVVLLTALRAHDVERALALAEQLERDLVGASLTATVQSGKLPPRDVDPLVVDIRCWAPNSDRRGWRHVFDAVELLRALGEPLEVRYTQERQGRRRGKADQVYAERRAA